MLSPILSLESVLLLLQYNDIKKIVPHRDEKRKIKQLAIHDHFEVESTVAKIKRIFGNSVNVVIKDWSHLPVKYRSKMEAIVLTPVVREF